MKLRAAGLALGMGASVLVCVSPASGDEKGPCLGPNLLVNPSFERPPVSDPSEFDSFLPGQRIPGWRIGGTRDSGGGIDLIGPLFWEPAAGSQSVDLSYFDAGSVRQRVVLRPGHRYRLRFSLAGNPDGGTSVKRMTVRWGRSAKAKAVFAFDTAGHSRESLGWSRHSLQLKATTKRSTFTFRSLQRDPFGPVLDAVSLRGFVRCDDATS
jgi:choice-of-anchor C domain-containing protein